MSNATKSPASTMAVPQKSNPAAAATVARRAKALEILGESLKIDPPMLMAILKNQIMPRATDDQIAAIVIVANVYDLNPILREIYAFPDPKRGGIVPVVGVDGWAKIVNRQEDYDGCEFEWAFDEKDSPHACTCKLYHKKRSHPIVVTEYLEECKRPTDPWKNMPKRMLRHKAFIQAVRLAFGISGIYDEDEAKDIVVTDARVTTAPAFLTPPEVINPPQARTAEEPPIERVEHDGTNGGERGAPEPEDRNQTAAEVKAATPAEPKKDVTEGLDLGAVEKLLKDLMKRDGVTEDQVMGHLKTQKIAKNNQDELMQLASSKLRNLANQWDQEVVEIRKVQV